MSVLGIKKFFYFTFKIAQSLHLFIYITLRGVPMRKENSHAMGCKAKTLLN